MLEFRCDRHVATTGMPVLSDVEIDAMAERVLEDYKPELLEKPGKINALHFIESYLGATVDYQDIYYKEGEAAILGATVFQDGMIRVFDREKLCAVPKLVRRGTVLLDNSIMCDGKEGLQLFTVLHEGGHLYMHRNAFRRMCKTDGQSEQLPGICCRQTTVGRVRRIRIRGEWTEEDFREHQANTFAAAMSMPAKTFVPLVKDFYQEIHLKTEVAYFRNADFEVFHLPRLLRILCETYGVSRTAALVQLKKRGLYTWKPKPAYDPMAFPY